MNCNKYWSNKKLFSHLRIVLKEFIEYPSDGSIEVELNETISLLRSRGVLV